MKVLVVDDDPSIQRILRRILSHFPCDVAVASNGAEALAAIEVAVPDLVLLDLNMPVMDGMATLASIRASPVHGDLPVVPISAVADRELVLKVADLGIADYLLKPLNIATTHARLQRVFASITASRADPTKLSPGS